VGYALLQRHGASYRAGRGQAEPVHKGLQLGYNDDAGDSEVMLVSNLVRDLIQIKRQNDLALAKSYRERNLFVCCSSLLL
jgi:hypothetical protein